MPRVKATETCAGATGGFSILPGAVREHGHGLGLARRRAPARCAGTTVRPPVPPGMTGLAATIHQKRPRGGELRVRWAPPGQLRAQAPCLLAHPGGLPCQAVGAAQT